MEENKNKTKLFIWYKMEGFRWSRMRGYLWPARPFRGRPWEDYSIYQSESRCKTIYHCRDIVQILQIQSTKFLRFYRKTLKISSGGKNERKRTSENSKRSKKRDEQDLSFLARWMAKFILVQAVYQRETNFACFLFFPVVVSYLYLTFFYLYFKSCLFCSGR